MRINFKFWVFLLLGYGLGYGGLAYAHAHLEKAVPVEGSILTTAPASFVLSFSESARLTALWLQKDAGPKQKLEPLPSESARQISIPAPHLAAGRYVLSWRVVSDDGHVMPGKLSFAICAAGAKGCIPSPARAAPTAAAVPAAPAAPAAVASPGAVAVPAAAATRAAPPAAPR